MSFIRKNDFSARVKRIAAEKVAYFCSFPDCRRITIGPHSKGEKSIKIGQAAHIYPASENGPRYNSEIEESFISSEDNCIWLCSNHHTLVDTDEKEYTANKLFEWKKAAEAFASEQLKISTIKFEEITTKKYDISLLDNVFKDYLIEGKILKLLNLIRSFEISNKDTNLYQLFSYYKIIVYFYNNYELVEDELNKFLKLDNILFLDRMITFFIENLDSKSLIIIENEIPTKFKKYADLVINNEVMGKLVVFEGEITSNIENKSIIKYDIADKELLNKLFSNFIFNNQNNYPRYILKNIFSDDNKLYKSEFIYNVRAYLFELINEMILNPSIINNELLNNEKYIWLLSVADTIKDYDLRFQKAYWYFILNVYNNHEKINEVIHRIPDDLNNDDTIKLIILSGKMRRDLRSVDFDYLLDLSYKTKNFTLVFTYLFNLPLDMKNDIFEKYPDVIYINSDILALWSKQYLFESQKINITDFEKKIGVNYSNDILYYVILIEYYYINNMDYSNLELKIDALFKEGKPITVYGLEYYINVLTIINNQDKLYEIMQWEINFDIKLGIISNLLILKTKYAKEIKTYLDELVDNNIEHPLIFSSLGTYYHNINNDAEALNNFKKAFDIQPSESNGYAYLVLKYNRLEEFSESDIIFCEKSKNPKLVLLLVQYYLRIGEITKAKDRYIYYFALTEGRDEEVFGNYFHILATYPLEKKELNYLNVGYTALIKNNEKYYYISIHKPSIIRDKNGSLFLGTHNYSENAEEVVDLMFKKATDDIIFKGNKYTIIKIEDTEIIYFRFLISKLKEKGSIETFTADIKNPAESIKQILQIVLDGSKKSKELIDIYNKNKIIPISLFMQRRGKGIITTMEYLLFENDDKIINNINTINDKNKILLSFDTIIQLNLVISYGLTINEKYELYITRSTLDAFNLEIINEGFELGSDSNSGVLAVQKGKVGFIEKTEDIKNSRKSYLRKLKRFISSLNIIEDTLYDSDNEIAKFMGEHNIKLELGLIKVMDNNEYTLLTDNPFMISICNVFNYENLGILGLITLSDNVKIIKQILSELSKFNYYYLVSWQLIKSIYNIDKDFIEDIISGKIFALENEEDIINHKKNIISIFQQNYMENNEAIINVMIKYVTSFFKELYPDKYQELLNNFRLELFQNL